MTNPYARLIGRDEETETAPAGVRDPYAEMLQNARRAQEQQRAATLNQAVRVNPDEEAELRQLRERGKQVMSQATTPTPFFSLPPTADLVSDPTQFKTDIHLQEIYNNTADTPALRNRYSDADFARIAHDDSWQLSGLEKFIKGIGFRGFQTEFPRAVVGNLAFRKMNGEVLSAKDEERLQKASALVAELTAEQEGRGVVSYALNTVGMTLGQLFTSLPTAAAGAAAGAGAGAVTGAGVALIGGVSGPQAAVPEEVVTVPAATLGGALIWGRRGYVGGVAVHNFTQIAGHSYLEYSAYRDINGQLMDPDVARGAALVVAALSTGAETFGDVTLSKALPGFERLLGAGGKEAAERLLATDAGRSALSRLGRRVAETSGVEAVTEGIQGVIEILGGEAAKQIAEGEFAPVTLEEAAARVGEGVLQGAIGGAGVPIVTAPVTVPVEQYFINRDIARAEIEAKSAEGQLNRLDAAIEAAGQSKLIKRDRAALEAFIDEAAQGTELSNVFIEADSLAQVAQDMGINVLTLARQLGVADQIQDSALTSTPIVVPVGKFIATVADTDMAGPLMEVAKMNPFLPSRAEIKAAKEAGEEQFVARAEALAAAAAQSETVRVEAQAISERIAGELTTVGRFTGDANRVYATAATQMYVQLAQRLGITPQQAFDSYPLRVAGQRIGGAQETQVLASEQADLPGSPQWEAAVAKGLDMSTEARMARAREMGFDTDTVLYHGTGEDIAAFSTSKARDVQGRRNALGLGRGKIYMSAEPNVASMYAGVRGGDASVMPLYVRGKLMEQNEYEKLFEKVSEQILGTPRKINEPYSFGYEQMDRDAIIDALDDAVKAQGFAGIKDNDLGQYAIFDPSNIRSVNAAFDPDQAASADLLAQEGLNLFDNPLPIDGKATVLKVGTAMTEAHMAQYGRKLYPEDSAEDYAMVLEFARAELAAQMQQPNSGHGWYSKDVTLAIEQTDRILPGLNTPEGRAVFLTFAGIFSSGLDPQQAWQLSVEAFEAYQATGQIPISRAEAARAVGNDPRTTTYKDKKTGEKVTQDAGWGPRNPGNEQQLQMFKTLIEQKGGPIEALTWLTTPQPRADINQLMADAGVKTPRYKTREEREGPPVFGAMIFSEKLGRYTLGLHGVEIGSEDTTVDLWYTRSYRRWTGRLLDKPIGNEGIVSQPDPARGGIERQTIFRLTGDLMADYPQLTAGDVQAMLWFFEKRLWGAQGIRTDEGTNSAGARQALERRGLEFDDGSRGGAAGAEGGPDVGGRPAEGTETLGQDEIDGRPQQPRAGDGRRAYSRGGLSPLEGAPANTAGPDPSLVAVAEDYAENNGIPLRRPARFAELDVERAQRIAAAFDAMQHAPNDPAVREAYEDLKRQTRAQYDALVAAGYVFTFYDGDTDPYAGNPMNAMRDLRNNKRMAVYGTYSGYGTEGVTEGDRADNPMLEDTGLQWPDQNGVRQPVTSNDLFRAVHDAFGHGLEGAGFRARGEENAWQAHRRLYTGPALAAATTELRGQNSWLNYGPYGEKNRTAKVEDTVFAENKIGLMPEWTWTEGVVEDMPDADETFGQDEITHHADGTRISVAEDVGQITVSSAYGEVKAYTRGDAIVVTGSFVEEGRRGQGIGTDLYQALANLAFQRGQVLVSDRSVTDQAAGAWRALAQRGYTVLENYVPGTAPDRVGGGGASPMGLNPFVALPPGKESMSYAEAVGQLLSPAMRRMQADMAADINEGAKRLGPETLGQSKAPVFYSALSRFVENTKINKAPASQWKGMLTNAPGIKAEEVEYSGVMDWLELQTGPVTREDLLDFISANGVRIEEVVRASSAAGNPRYDQIQREMLPLIEENDRILQEMNGLEDGPEMDALSERHRANDARIQELRLERLDISSRDMDETKWSYYTLPGGENYTELLLTLPEAETEEIPTNISDLSPNQKRDFILFNDRNADVAEIPDSELDNVIVEMGLDQAAFDTFVARGMQIKQQRSYRSGHWPEPNVLAHVRFKERVGPNGERVLALEEIQSDWHQAGRKKGYRPARLDREALAAAEARLDSVLAKYNESMRALTAYVGWAPDDLKYQRLVEQADAANAEYVAAVNAVDEIRGRPGTVSDAPFKNNAWVNLVLKRMIRHAAENGFDAVAWIPGNIQNGQVVETKDNRSDFYDEIVPNAANKLGKKYGARVGRLSVSTPNKVGTNTPQRIVQGPNGFWHIQWDTGDLGPGFATEAEAQAQLNKHMRAIQFHFLPITPALRAVAIEEGFSLFARGRRGEYSPRLKEIRLNASADFSTFLHELGHHFLEVYDATALTLRDKEAAGETLTDGEQGVLDDTRRLLTELARQTNTEVEGDVLDWWRSQPFDARVPMHEQFARLTEAYFMDGKAPTPELQTMFQTFKRWMLQVYKSLTELNVDLNDEVRGILDRMVAAADDIDTAQENRGLNPVFATKPEFMSDDEWYGYQQLALAATQAAEEELTARSLRDMKWLSRAKAREIRRLQKEAAEQRALVEADVTAEVMSRPVNRARTFLKRGLNPDGTEVRGPHKLSIDLLKAAYPNGEWKALGYGRYGMLAKEGLDADMIAELFGFESGDAMIRALLETEPAEVTIEGETDRRMLEEFGDLVNEEAINRAADEALHNVFRGRVLSAEYDALAKASGQRKMMASAAQQIAKQVIGRQIAAKLRPQQYIAAERTAARKAERALKRNDLIGAATAKRDQLLNFELAREAQRVLKQRNRMLDLFRKVTAAKRDTVSKTRNFDLVQVARAILAAHGMGQVRNAPIEYMDLLKQYDPRLYTSMEATLLVAAAKQTTIAEMSVDEFLGLGDLIGQLWALSREEKQIEIEGRKVELEQITTELTTRLAELGDTERAQITAAATETQKALRSAVGLLASMRRVEFWSRSMDGGKVGPFTKYIWRPISEAADRYRADRNRLITQFRELFRAIEPTMGGKKIAAPELSYTFQNKAELLHAILHTGNVSNKRKLLLGRQWGAERSDGTLDDSRWQQVIARLAQDGTLTQADFDFVQGVWDLLEETKPLAQETHRKVFGRYFAEITAEPVETPFGTYRGGYVPAIYDQFFVADAAVRAQQEQVEANDSTMFPSPASGFTKSRVEYNEVLELNLQLLPMHIDRVLKFAHLASPVRDVLRILRDKETARALEQVDPTAQTDMLLPWLQRAARQIVEEPSKGQAGKMADRFFRGIRNRSGMGLMFANLVNVAQQFTGFPLVLLQVKARYVGAALVRYTANPARMTKAARGASMMMVERGDNQMSAMYNEIEKIIDQKNLYGRTVDWLGRHTYFMQQAVQNVMDVVVWTAAYDQALANGATEAEAAKQGDAVVRQTQGSVFSEDIARIETGPAWARTFTHMYSYFSMWGNLLAGEVETTMRELGLRKGAGRLMFVYMIGFLAPAILAQLIADALRGQLPEDEDDDGYLDEWLSWFFMTKAKTMLAFVPIAGQAGNAAIGAFTDVPYDDRVGGSPAISAVEGAVRTPASVYNAIFEDGDQSRAVKDTLNLMTLLTGIPFQAAARPISYAVDVAEGDIDPVDNLDYLRGLASGTASEASR